MKSTETETETGTKTNTDARDCIPSSHARGVTAQGPRWTGGQFDHPVRSGQPRHHSTHLQQVVHKRGSG